MSTEWKDAEYWRQIHEQEMDEEEARWLAKCELEKKMNAEVKEKRVWTDEEIRHLLETNDTMLYRSLLKLYDRQTADEQADGQTKEHNGVGFNGLDAPILSSMAEFLKRTGFLTVKQRTVARKKMMKYVKQLTRIANQ